MTLWSSADAEKATGGRSNREWSAGGVSIDSRSLAEGDLFIALSDNRDGHTFVRNAFEAGASAAVVEKEVEGLPERACLLKVADGLAALEKLGLAARDRSSAKVIAVTGSSGKTSTKEMLRQALSAQGPTHAAEHSYNNHWGVPLTLARLPRAAEFAVIEIGMNRPGEISPLSKIAKPHACLITTVGIAHLASFSSVEGIAAEKASIILGMEPGGTAVVNRDSPGFEIFRKAAAENSANLIPFGEGALADWRMAACEDSETGTLVRASIPGRRVAFKLASRGRHFAMNALGALAAIDSVGGDIEAAMPALETWEPPAGRGSRYKVWLDGADSPIVLIDDTFNANPSSLDAALTVLASIEPGPRGAAECAGRRIAILGDMLELGSEGPALHERFSRHGAMDKISVVHCVGRLMRNLYMALPQSKRGLWRESSSELSEISAQLASPGDVALVKGSKGSKISIVAEAMRKLNRRQVR